MRVLQFGFGDGDANIHQAGMCPEDSVVYSGTHDNNTTAGWWNLLSKEERTLVCEGMNVTPDTSGEEIAKRFIQQAITSRASLAMFPLQDLLYLDETARMNTPGTAEENWNWRWTQEFPEETAIALRQALRAGDRLSEPG